MQTTIIIDQAAWDAAYKLARGSYQRALLNGWQRYSGADLKGRARIYGGQYARSRDALLHRMTAAGIPWCTRKGERGTIILVIGAAR